LRELPVESIVTRESHLSFFAEFILSGNELLRLHFIQGCGSRGQHDKRGARNAPSCHPEPKPERSEGAGEGSGDSSVAEFTLSEAEVFPRNDKRELHEAKASHYITNQT